MMAVDVCVILWYPFVGNQSINFLVGSWSPTRNRAPAFLLLRRNRNQPQLEPLRALVVAQYSEP